MLRFHSRNGWFVANNDIIIVIIFFFIVARSDEIRMKMELDRYRILFYKLIRLARCVLCYTGYIYLQTRDAGVFFFFFSKGHICSYMRVWKCKTQSPWPCYSAWLNVTVFPFFFIEASHFSCKRIKYTAKCFLRNYKFFLSFLSFFFQKEERKKNNKYSRTSRARDFICNKTRYCKWREKYTYVRICTAMKLQI